MVRTVNEQVEAQRLAMFRLVESLRQYSETSERVVDGHGTRRGVHKTAVRALSFLIQRQAQGLETTPSDLTKHLRISSPSTTALLDRMTAQGQVVRERSERDRRSVRIVATEAAIAEGRQLFSPIVAETSSALAQFDSEQLATASEVLDAATGALLRVEAGYRDA